MSRLICLTLIGLLLVSLAGGFIPCPETSCCDSKEEGHDDGCDLSCRPCVCCLDRTPVDAVTLAPPVPVQFISSAVLAAVITPPAPEPSDILKIPKASVA